MNNKPCRARFRSVAPDQYNGVANIFAGREAVSVCPAEYSLLLIENLMPFDIEFTEPAANHVRGYRKFEQRIILESIAAQLAQHPTTKTRNKKPLSKNELSDWELRI
jgi:hypothetical protein